MLDGRVPFHKVVGKVEYDEVGLVPVRTCISIDGFVLRIDELIRTVDLRDQRRLFAQAFGKNRRMTYQCFVLLTETDQVPVEHPNGGRIPTLALGAELGEVRVHREPRLGGAHGEAARRLLASVPLDTCCQRQEYIEDGKSSNRDRDASRISALGGDRLLGQLDFVTSALRLESLESSVPKDPGLYISGHLLRKLVRVRHSQLLSLEDDDCSPEREEPDGEELGGVLSSSFRAVAKPAEAPWLVVVLHPHRVPAVASGHLCLPAVHFFLKFRQFPVVSQEPLVSVVAIQLDVVKMQDEIELLLTCFPRYEVRANVWSNTARHLAKSEGIIVSEDFVMHLVEVLVDSRPAIPTGCDVSWNARYVQGLFAVRERTRSRTSRWPSARTGLAKRSRHRASQKPLAALAEHCTSPHCAP